MTYELINRRTGNTLDSFESEADAIAVYREFRGTDPEFADELELVEFNENGEAVDSTPASTRAAELVR